MAIVWGHAQLRRANRSILPEVLEPVWRQLRVVHRVHDVLVAKVVLESPRVPPIVGELEATKSAFHGGDNSRQWGCSSCMAMASLQLVLPEQFPVQPSQLLVSQGAQIVAR